MFAPLVLWGFFLGLLLHNYFNLFSREIKSFYYCSSQSIIQNLGKKALKSNAISFHQSQFEIVCFIDIHSYTYLVPSSWLPTFFIFQMTRVVPWANVTMCPMITGVCGHWTLCSLTFIKAVVAHHLIIREGNHSFSCFSPWLINHKRWWVWGTTYLYRGNGVWLV